MKFTFTGAPVTHSEYTTLRLYSMVMFTYIYGSEQHIPLQTNPIVNVKALVDFFAKYGSGKKGVRFYPGFYGQRLVLVMCADDEISDVIPGNWCLLDKGFYNAPGVDLVNIPHNQAKAIHNAYLTQIFIDGNPYAPSPSNRISRFYFWNEILTFIEQNLNGGNYAEFFMHLEWGYVPVDLAPVFNARFPVGSAEYHQGFTVILHLKDKDGNPLIDVQLPYQAGQYNRTYLEVGSPCPPRCGDI